MIMLCRRRYNRRVKKMSSTSVLDDTCQQHVAAWLACDWDDLSWETLRVEASHRTFLRVRASKKSYVVMSSPPHLEANDQFVTVAEVFGRHQVPVPRILHSEPQLGLYLMADLGRTHLQDTYGTDQQDKALAAAIDALLLIGPIRDPAIPAYSEDRLIMELGIYSEWFVQGLLKQDGTSSSYDQASRPLIDAMLAQPEACVHRDYHCRNLLFEDGVLGIVDFQDALIGPALYDLATLFTDCYHEFADPVIDHWLDIYTAKLPGDHALAGVPRQTLRMWLDFTGVQRQLKAIGIFSRLQIRDNKDTHIAYIEPNLRRVIERADRYPELSALCAQLRRDAEAFQQR